MITQIRTSNANFAQTLMTVINVLKERTPKDDEKMLVSPETQQALKELAELRVHQSAMVERLLGEQQKWVKAEQEAQARGLSQVLSGLKGVLEEGRKSSDAALDRKLTQLDCNRTLLNQCSSAISRLADKIDQLDEKIAKKDVPTSDQTIQVQDTSKNSESPVTTDLKGMQNTDIPTKQANDVAAGPQPSQAPPAMPVHLKVKHQGPREQKETVLPHPTISLKSLVRNAATSTPSQQ